MNLRKLSMMRDLGKAIMMARSFFPYLRPYRWQLGFTIGVGTLASLLGVCTPALTKYVFDEILLKKNLPLYLMFLSAYAAVFVAMQLLGIVRGYLSLYVSSFVHYRLRLAYLNHLSRLSYLDLMSKPLGEHVVGINSDISSVGQMIISLFPNLLNSVVALSAAVVIMMKMNWRVTVLYIFVVPCVLLFRLYVTTLLKTMQERVRELDGRVNSALCDAIRLMPCSKLLARERGAVHSYSSVFKERVAIDFKMWKLQTITGQAQWLMESGPTTLLTCLVWLLVLRSTMSMGSALAFSMYFGMILPPFTNAINLMQQLIMGLVPGQRLQDFLNQPAEVRKPMRIRAFRSPPAIEFREVTFSFKQPDHEVLKNISFVIPGGSMVAIMGPSGSGKTTLLNLICTAYQPDSGSILLDDFRTEHYDVRSIREQMSYAPQEPMFFAGTIADSILHGRPDASQADMMAAIGCVCAGDFVDELPEGLDTQILGEHCRLSSGQKQRLGLARAIARHSVVLLLDEPFANLDAETEQLLWSNLHALKKRCSVILVTHRPPPAGIVDLLLYVENGTVREIPQGANVFEDIEYIQPATN